MPDLENFQTLPSKHRFTRFLSRKYRIIKRKREREEKRKEDYRENHSPYYHRSSSACWIHPRQIYPVTIEKHLLGTGFTARVERSRAFFRSRGGLFQRLGTREKLHHLFCS